MLSMIVTMAAAILNDDYDAIVLDRMLPGTLDGSRDICELPRAEKDIYASSHADRQRQGER